MSCASERRSGGRDGTAVNLGMFLGRAIAWILTLTFRAPYRSACVRYPGTGAFVERESTGLDVGLVGQPGRSRHRATRRRFLPSARLDPGECKHRAPSHRHCSQPSAARLACRRISLRAVPSLSHRALLYPNEHFPWLLFRFSSRELRTGHASGQRPGSMERRSPGF